MYLFTFPLSLDGGLEVTVFYSSSEFDAMTGVPSNLIEPTSGRFIDLTVHGPSRRSFGHAFSSDLSEHPLIFSEEIEDLCLDDDLRATPLPGHKTGGRPYRLSNRTKLFDEIDRRQNEGYCLISQMEFMVKSDERWQGNWPFADGIFMLFGKMPFMPQDWCWVWHF